MAIAGKHIWNKKTRQQIKFLQTSKDTNGAFLEMLTVYPPQSNEPPPHYHPEQDEYFEVTKGQLTIRLGNELKYLTTGEKLHIAKGQAHSMWNTTNEETEVNWKVMPAMTTEYFLETLTGLANDNKTDASGVPSILQISLTANKYNQVFRLAKPSYAVQRIVFTLCSPIAFLLGYRPDYDDYLN
ncbi:MAG TPA: cupin domain-containing protein [Cyclobacteriaceae bacterium]